MIVKTLKFIFKLLVSKSEAVAARVCRMTAADEVIIPCMDIAVLLT
jgi:hypothetical protein